MYVVSGNHYSKGIVGDDSSTLDQYWELGWECGVSNIYIKQLLFEGKLNKDDIIVTRSGREFFYSSVFDNVIDWETFCNLKVDNSDVLSIPDKLDISKLLDYNYENVDVDLVCNFDLCRDIETKYDIRSNFMIFCVRLRDHGSYRNANIDVTKQLINLFLNDGFKVFIVGYGSEFLENELDVTYVDLCDYASLLNSEYCKFCISTLSGIIHLANFCGHDNLYAFILDHAAERRQNNHPIYMGDNINYKNIKTKFIPGAENYEIIKEFYSNFIINEKTV